MATVPRTADEIDALWDYDDPPGSERRFRELLERLKAERAEADPPILRRRCRAHAGHRLFGGGAARLEPPGPGEKDQHVVEEIAACLTALGRAGEARS